MAWFVRSPAPDFRARAVMPDRAFGQVRPPEFRGTSGLLFFYPLDFSFVCRTEMIAFSDRIKPNPAECRGFFTRQYVEVAG